MTAPDDIEHANARMQDAFRQADALRQQLAASEAQLDEERAHVARLVREVQEMAARRDEAAARADRAEAEGAGRLRAIAQHIIERIGARPESVAETVGRLIQALDRAEAERDALKAKLREREEDDADLREALDGVTPDSLHDWVRSIAAERDALETLVRKVRERLGVPPTPADAVPGRILRELAFREGERDAAKARALPGGRDPGAKAYDAGPCTSCGNPIEGRDYYRFRDVGDDGGYNYHHDCWEWLRRDKRGPRPRPIREAPRALPVVPATCGECRHGGDAADGRRACYHPDADRDGAGPPLTPPDGTPAWCPIRSELAKAGGL